MQLLLSFDQDMRVKKTLIQTLASQLSFDQDMRVEKTLTQIVIFHINLTMQVLTSGLHAYCDSKCWPPVLFKRLFIHVLRPPVQNTNVF